MPIYMGIFEKPNVLDKKFKGDVKAKDYEGWIELQSAQLGGRRNITTGSGGNSSRAQREQGIEDIVITKLLDSVSTALTREALISEKGMLIVIAFVKADGTTHLKMVLQNTLIGHFNISVGGGTTDARVMESFTLSFAKITFEMQPTSPNTTHSQLYQLSQQATWDHP